jgi:phospholipid N-methyltransferase
MPGSEFQRQFSFTWEGGYYEGDVRDPMGSSTLGVFGYNSVLYTTYLACIRPYVEKGATVLEIGPGRGAWSKPILDQGAGILYAVDAASAEHTGFWKYVGNDARAKWIVSEDFNLSEIPDNSVDFVFSIGCFCHLRPEMCEAYVEAIARKMKPGANAIIGYADFDQYMRVVSHPEQNSLLRFFLEQKRKVWAPTKLAYFFTWRLFRRRMDLQHVSKEKADNLTDAAGRASWYHWGVEAATAAVKRAGLDLVEADLGAISRDPLMHFRKLPNVTVERRSGLGERERTLSE